MENSNELENENSIFYIDDSDEDVNINLLENENKKVDDEINLFSFNHNSEHSIQPSVDVHFNNNLDDSINLYFDINAFKDIVTKNYLKTRSSTNLDIFTPLTKKVRNNFTIEDIVPDTL